MNLERATDDVESPAASEEQLAAWLASYDSAWKAGTDSLPAFSPDQLSPELHVRLRRAQACLHLLDQARPGPDNARTDTKPSLHRRRISAAALSTQEEALLGVLQQEIRLRQGLGEGPQLSEYLDRFPQYAEHLRESFLVASGDTAVGTPSPDKRSSLAAADSSVVPVHVPGYEIVGEIGRGGMGIVYKAWQVRLKRLVALKMIRSGTLAETEALQRFSREAETIARLKHPNIVQIYEVGECKSGASGTPIPYFAFEYVEGGSLAWELAGALLPAAQAAALAETLARAIHAAHDAGIVHRDLKPANVLLSKFPGQRSKVNEKHGAAGLETLDAGPWTPKITDFGLAKQLDAEAGQTSSGIIVGTPSYMAPEQAAGRNEHVGPAVDIYALGAILYEMLTGRPPFKAASSVETVMLVLHEDPVAPSRLCPRMPRDLEVICLKCLEKQPARRYTSALALAEDLRRFQAGEPIEARPTPAWERGLKWARRHPTTAALWSVSGLAVAIVLGIWLGFTSELRTERDHAKEKRAEAVKNYRLARSAVDKFLNEMADDDDLVNDGLDPMRKRLLESALEFYQEFVKGNHDDPELRSDLADAHFRLGKICRSAFSIEDALQHFGRAQKLYQRLIEDQPETADHRERLAHVCTLLGLAYRQTARHSESQECLLRAVNLYNELLPYDPASLQYRSGLANSYLHLGWLYNNKRDWERAEEAYQKGISIFEQLVQENQASDGDRYHLGNIYHQLSNVYARSKRADKADQVAQKALGIRRELAEQFPEVRKHKLALTLSLNVAGVHHEEAGRLAQAEEFYVEALAIREQIAQAHPTNLRNLVFLTTSLHLMAEIYQRTERGQQALPLLQRALAISEKLMTIQPTVRDHLLGLKASVQALVNYLRREGQVSEAEKVLSRVLIQHEGLPVELRSTFERHLASLRELGADLQQQK